LGLGSFDSPKRPLARKQASLRITFNGIKLILTSTITPIAYSGNLALVVLVITARFMVDHLPFLLEALAQIDNNTFPFQQHFRAACDLLPPLARACFLLFEQLIRQQMVQLQDSISKHLHHHALSNMLFDGTFEAHCAKNLSCSGPGADIWFIVQPVYLAFQLSSLTFCTTLRIQLRVPHSSITYIL
jgi:hypothetical protein